MAGQMRMESRTPLIGNGPKRSRALKVLPTRCLWKAVSGDLNADGEWSILDELQLRSDGRHLLYPDMPQTKWAPESPDYPSMDLSTLISVVISSSPIPAHPNTEVIDACYTAMRKHLPASPTYILLDGVRDEQAETIPAYAEYKQALKNQARKNTQIVESPEFRHEAGQMRAFLRSGICKTPLICYLQHDAVLSPENIDWQGIAAALLDSTVSCVRFALDVGFPHGKEHMFRGCIMTHGVPLLLITELFTTACIARADFFEHIVSHFDAAQCHLDGDEIQPVTAKDDGKVRRIGCYCPFDNEDCGYKRVSHADARRAGIENPPSKFPTRL